jgi:hypothetical protein
MMSDMTLAVAGRAKLFPMSPVHRYLAGGRNEVLQCFDVC